MDDVFFLQNAWSDTGFTIPLIHVGDGQAAIRWLTARQTSDGLLPKLVLTDLKMPGMSGFEFLKFLGDNDAFHELVALVWSNSDQPEDITRAYTLGARSYLHKPMTQDGWRLLVEQLKELYQDAPQGQIGCRKHSTDPLRS